MGSGAGLPVSDWMVSPVVTVSESDSLAAVHLRLERHGISGVPVMSSSGALCGVITHADLLKAGKVKRLEQGEALELPKGPARAFATPEVEVATPDTPLRACAKRMVKSRIHRLYLLEHSRVVGVVSTLEMMKAVAKGEFSMPLSEVTRGKLVCVRSGDPISLAVDRLKAAHRSALVVMDQDWPVGTFSLAEAVKSGRAPGDDPVETWMDERLICLPERLSVSRAAAQAATLNVRRVVVMDESQPVGIVSGLDFARVAQITEKKGT